MVKNPSELLKKDIALNLFLTYKENFGFSSNLKISKIERFLTWSEETYILLFEIDDSANKKFIRGNSSTKHSRLNAFEVIKTLNQNGFNEDNFLVPKNPLFIPDYNLLLYENIEGKTLIDELRDGDDLTEKIELTAQWLAKLHKLDYPINIGRYEFTFFTNSLNNFYPDLAKEIEQIKIKLISETKFDRRLLIHGDFQPNNIIIADDEACLFDFNDSACDNPMIDVASFLSQLKVMLLRFSDVKKFDELEKIFLKEYDKNYPINSEMKNDIKKYEALHYLRILAWLCGTLPKEDPEIKKTIPKIYDYFQESKN